MDQAEREQSCDVLQLAVDRHLPQLALDVPGRAQLSDLRLGQRHHGDGHLALGSAAAEEHLDKLCEACCGPCEVFPLVNSCINNLCSEWV